MAITHYPATREGEEAAFAVDDPKVVVFDGGEFVVSSGEDYSPQQDEPQVG